MNCKEYFLRGLGYFYSIFSSILPGSGLGCEIKEKYMDVKYGRKNLSGEEMYGYLNFLEVYARAIARSNLCEQKIGEMQKKAKKRVCRNVSLVKVPERREIVVYKWPGSLEVVSGVKDKEISRN